MPAAAAPAITAKGADWQTAFEELITQMNYIVKDIYYYIDLYGQLSRQGTQNQYFSQYELLANKGIASGYCPLDATSHVPDANIPTAIARDTEVSGAIATHVAAADPHVGYMIRFPVGAYYFNSTGVNPGTELGFGTWMQVAEGLILVGAP